MLRAAFDTSSSHASFALYKGGEVLVSESRECQRGASKLLPWVSSLIIEKGYKVADVEQWYVGIGPGSFTGLRVGLSFVKGICYASKQNYRGVNSGIAYLAEMTCESGQRVSVLHDGRKKEVLVNSFEKSATGWKELGVEVMTIVDLPEYFGEFGQMVSLMDVELFPEVCRDQIKQIAHVDAASYLHVGLTMPATQQEMDKSCEPIYVRPAVFIQPIKVKRNI